MEKIWKDGRVKVELNSEEAETVENAVRNETPSNKEIIKLLKLIIDILTS